MEILGFDIGGTKTAIVLGNDSGAIHGREVFATQPSRGFPMVLADMVERAKVLMVRERGEGYLPEALSVSIGGPLKIEEGIVLSPPNLPGWDEVPLKKLLEDRLGLPCHVEHDGNAGALAEWMFGAAQGTRNAIFLTMGTGFGGGLILNGDIYHGATDTAGEVGHVRLADEGPEAYGKEGSWEAFCSGTGIVRLAARMYPHRWAEGGVSMPELAEAARNGDGDAKQVIETAGEYLGRGLAMLVDVLNPEVIVIGSLAVRLGDLVLEPARRVVRDEALSVAADACRIVPAALGEQIGDVAALCAAIAAKRRDGECVG